MVNQCVSLETVVCRGVSDVGIRASIRLVSCLRGSPRTLRCAAWHTFLVRKTSNRRVYVRRCDQLKSVRHSRAPRSRFPSALLSVLLVEGDYYVFCTVFHRWLDTCLFRRLFRWFVRPCRSEFLPNYGHVNRRLAVVGPPQFCHGNKYVDTIG